MRIRRKRRKEENTISVRHPRWGLVENDQPGLVARRKTLVYEGKGVRILDLDVSIGKKLVGAAGGVHRNAAQQTCLNHVRERARQSAGTGAIFGDCGFEARDVFVYLERAKVFEGVGADELILAVLVGRGPEHASNVGFAGMLSHGGGENFQEGMSVGDSRAALKGASSGGRIVQLHVLQEAELVVELPAIRIGLNAAFD